MMTCREKRLLKKIERITDLQIHSHHRIGGCPILETANVLRFFSDEINRSTDIYPAHNHA